MTVYDETIAAVRALAARARTTENVLFCEQRPLTSLEAQFAGAGRLSRDLREIEDDAIRALKRLVDAEQGYETALQSIEEAGADATAWLRAVMLARSLETLS
jgi:phosphoribosyl-dephospho-CoA transferase